MIAIFGTPFSTARYGNSKSRKDHDKGEKQEHYNAI